MREPTLVLGVDHGIEYLAQTIDFLERQTVQGKHALLEIPKEAVSWDAKRIYEKSPFFFVVDRYLKARGAWTIYGDSYALCQKADESAKELAKGFVRRNKGFLALFRDVRGKMDQLEKELGEISSRERNPHFLTHVSGHQPEIIILGEHHAQYVIREYYKKYNVPYLYRRNHDGL